ncbi:MAG: class I adenylate cyclase [Gammaproteobacteria bacterium]|nr:class I adenylate cyclase [Gammaproteobacteria bacterium]
MDVIGAREAFYSWNNQCLKQLYRCYDTPQKQALKLIPLLLQVNSRLLPGYNGADVPAGIYGYKPDNKLINIAKQLNNKFSYQQEGVLKNTLIESVFLRSGILDDDMSLWVIHASNMKLDQFDELNDKISRIIIWLKNRSLKISFHLTSAEKIATGGYLIDGYTSVASFLDDFYVQAILLAGKYPAWWLVPPDDEIEYDLFIERIKSARFVNEHEFIDTGSIIVYKKDDFLAQAIRDVQDIYKSPEIIWFKLLLLGMKQDGWSRADGLAMQLKRMVYDEVTDHARMEPVNIVVSALQVQLEAGRSNFQTVDKTLSLIRRFSLGVNGRLINTLVGNVDKQGKTSELEDLSKYLALYKGLFAAVKSVFDKIVRSYRELTIDASNQQMLDTAANFSHFLAESNQRIPIYNLRQRSNIFQPKILIRHIADNMSGPDWVLVVDKGDEVEEVLYQSSSLLGIISWGVLNRVVDISTLVSVNSPQRVIRQIDARHVLEILLQQIDVDVITNVPSEVFKHLAHPLRSLVFVNVFSAPAAVPEIDNTRQAKEAAIPSITCEQLVINSWGDAYVKQYMGNDGVLQCLCEWLNASPASSSVRPHVFNVYGYAVGDSTSLSQRLTQIYDDIVEFFYTGKQQSGCFIVRLENSYYRVELKTDKFEFYSIGGQRGLFRFLEQPVDQYIACQFEHYALPEIPLRDIYKLNKPGVIQLFFQVGAQHCTSWVLNEKGALCQFHQSLFVMESFVKQWLLTIRNIRNRLKKINYQDRDLPKLEILQLSINQLGGLDFYPVEPGSISRQRDFIDVHLLLKTEQAITLTCEGHVFDYETFGDAVMGEAIAYIKQQFSSVGRLPVYITDIDLPISLLGFEQGLEPQTLFYLKYKRDFENRIASLL